MGHIDSGKTTFLDKIKGTYITDKEPGKITQHIGATEITHNTIIHSCGHLLAKFKFEVTIPGLLFIDTPGHNAFDNLRERGGSLADLVVLVVDITKGLQAQDIETLNILKMYKVPFIVVANKVDLLQGWYQEGLDVSYVIEKQSKSVSERLDEQIYKIVGQLYNHGFAAERFDRVTDFKKQVTIIPISAEKCYGLSESILFLATLSQKFLGNKLELDEKDFAQATILESGEIKGVGSTADIIVYQGIIRVKDKIAFLSKTGVIETKIKALLKLDVMSAVNKKRDYKNVDFVSAAAGVKIVAPDLDKCIPGSVIISCDDTKAIESLRTKPLSCVITNGEAEGAFIKTDTLGSLEALIKLMGKSFICIARSDIGDVTSKDVMELKIIHERDPKKGVLFLFNSNISKELEDEVNKSNIPIFKNNIIYKLIEDYESWLIKINKQEKDKLLKEIVYPCKIKVVKNCIFRVSKPSIFGVKVLAGKLVPGVTLLDKDGNEFGVVEGIQTEGNKLNSLEFDKEAAISVKGVTYLKDFTENSVFTVNISLEDIKKLEEIGIQFTDDEEKLIEEAQKRRYKTHEMN